MSEKRNSCLMRLGIGCAGIFVLFILIGVIIAMTLQANVPEEAVFTTLDGDSEYKEYQPFILPGGDANQRKPIKVYLRSTASKIRVIPSNEPSVHVSGEFDQANYELKTSIEDKGDHTAYYINFGTKGTLWAQLIMNDGEMQPDDNKLSVHLPVDQILDLNLNHEIGGLDVDLTGLAVRELDVEFSKGETSISMGGLNPVPMEKFKVQVEMGDHDIYDLQNYNFEKAKIESSMGELSIFNSGEFNKNEIQMDIDHSMGALRLELPENSRLSKKPSVTFGESRVSRNETPDSEIKTEIDFRGGVSLGEYRVTYATSRPSIVRYIRRRINLGLEPMKAFEEAKQMFESNNEAYSFDKNQLNTMGYRYLTSGYKEEAIEIFKLNVLFNPDYANGYDSLGEGYMTNGDTELAIINYERSLELNPNNFNAKQMLKRLHSKGSANKGNHESDATDSSESSENQNEDENEDN